LSFHWGRGGGGGRDGSVGFEDDFEGAGGRRVSWRCPEEGEAIEAKRRREMEERNAAMLMVEREKRGGRNRKP